MAYFRFQVVETWRPICYAAFSNVALLNEKPVKYSCILWRDLLFLKKKNIPFTLFLVYDSTEAQQATFQQQTC